MDYNELKLLILRRLSRSEPMDSAAVTSEMMTDKVAVDIHAIRMALMRYYKQGLLKRERTGGVFSYTLTQRGFQRLRWLEEQTKAQKRTDYSMPHLPE